MTAVTPPEQPTFTTTLAKHALPIAAVAIALFAFHWQSVRADAERVRERADERAATLSQTASLAAIQPLMSNDAPGMMIFLEELVRSNRDVLSAKIGDKDGTTIASTQAERIDESESSSARAITQPILVHGAGTPFAVGTLDLRIATKNVELAAAAGKGALAIEGGVCLLVCGGLFALKRKTRGSSAGVPAKRSDEPRSPANIVHEPVALPAPIAPQPKRDDKRTEPAAPLATQAKRDEKRTEPAAPMASTTKRSTGERGEPAAPITTAAKKGAGDPIAPSVPRTTNATPNVRKRRDPLAPEPLPASSDRSVDEAVEIDLRAPPAPPASPS